MAYTLIGAGAFSGAGGAAGTINTAYTPAWGSGSRTANNLLVCAVAGTQGGQTPATPSGWTLAVSSTGTTSKAIIFYKIAAGGDAAPTLAASATMVWLGMLFEFSGNATSLPSDKNGGTNVTTSPVVATASAADTAAGELVVAVGAAFYSTAATKTLGFTLNNGATASDSDNDATSTVNHGCATYGVTTGNAAADTASMAFTTTKITEAAASIASFKLGAATASTQQLSYRFRADDTQLLNSTTFP